MTDLLYKDECYAIMGACFAVYKELGCGFTEPVYQECLTLEMRSRGIPFLAQPELKLRYKGQELEKTFEPDFICHDQIILEIKSVSKLLDKHRAQVHNYLKVTALRLALLVNFSGFPDVDWERIVH